MTEATDRADPQIPIANEPAARASNPPVENRLSDPNWIDWCDGDR